MIWCKSDSFSTMWYQLSDVTQMEEKNYQCTEIFGTFPIYILCVLRMHLRFLNKNVNIHCIHEGVGKQGEIRHLYFCNCTKTLHFITYASDWWCLYYPCVRLFNHGDLIFRLDSFRNFLWVLLMVLVIPYTFTFSFISDAMGTLQPLFPPECSLLCFRAVHGVFDFVIFYFVWYLHWSVYLLVLTRLSASCIGLGTSWLVCESLISKVEGISILEE